MDMNSVSTQSRNERAVPRISQSVHILLVVHNVASLMFLASRFEKQQYQVTTAESASGALDIMKKRNSNFDIVIADFDMPGMAIYEFVREVHLQSITIPVILIAEDVTMELAREARDNGVCYLFSKPPSDRDIVYTWHHVSRLTGELPALTDITSSIDGEKYGNPGSGNSCGGAAINRNLRNMGMKIMNSDEENNTVEDFGCNPKKSQITCTAFPHAKFLLPINILGEHRAHPNSILGMMEPGLTHIQVSSHVQETSKLHLNPQETAFPVVPTVLPTVPFGNFKKEQTSDNANSKSVATQGALQIPRSNYVGYTLEYVEQQLNALNYSGNNTTGIQASAQLTNGLQDPNQEPIGDLKTGTLGFGNADNLANISHANFGEGNGGANQQFFSEMSGNDDIYKVIQDLIASEVNLSDLIY